MNDLELWAWASFVDVVKNFFGKLPNRKLQEVSGKAAEKLQDIGTNISIKVYFLQRHLDIGDVSDERFHQDIKTLEERYQGRWDKHIMADTWWIIKRDLNNIEHYRQSPPHKKREKIFTIFLMFMKVLFLLLV